VSATVEVHVPPQLVVSPDDRMWIGSTMENESGPIHWWSSPLDVGGEARHETGLTGQSVAWGDGVRVTADAAGRVVLSGPEGDRVVSDRRPDDCERPDRFPDGPVTVLLAAARPVVTYWCRSAAPEAARPLTVVYEQGQPPVEVDGASALAADDRHVLLSGNRPGATEQGEHPGSTWTYLVDLDERTVSRLGRGPHEAQEALRAGMVLWNSPGHLDDRSVYDVTWQVARID
jgi:hypothetical protein